MRPKTLCLPPTPASAGSQPGPASGRGPACNASASDSFLGWLRTVGLDGRQRDFYVRQLWDGKVSVDTTNLTPATVSVYGRICGWTLARAHARSGDRMAIASYLGTGPTFDRAVSDFAVAYAVQNERDYAAFAKAIKTGALPVERGV